MIDEYFDFCDKALMRADEKTSKAITFSSDTLFSAVCVAERNLLKDYFPLKTGNSRSQGTTCKDAADFSKLPTNLLKDDIEDVVLSGESYTIYNARDVLGTLPEEYELVISRAARWVGVPGEYLSGVIEKFERRVVHWWDGEKRRLKEEEGEP
jgi:RNA polymerase I-specific transcription initiation factor RRN7